MNAPIRTFDTGATRDADTDKYDFEGFLHPSVLDSYAAYMHKNRKQADGNLRDSDNWQKGIPVAQYMKSMFRHFMEVWGIWRGSRRGNLEESLNALLFNVMGMQFEMLKQSVPVESSYIGVDYTRPPQIEQPGDGFVWIPWDGNRGSIPFGVDSNALLRLQCRGGHIATMPAGKVSWIHAGADDDVIRFRAVMADEQ